MKRINLFSLLSSRSWSLPGQNLVLFLPHLTKLVNTIKLSVEVSALSSCVQRVNFTKSKISTIKLQKRKRKKNEKRNFRTGTSSRKDTQPPHNNNPGKHSTIYSFYFVFIYSVLFCVTLATWTLSWTSYKIIYSKLSSYLP
jgi:hypothetical protein